MIPRTPRYVASRYVTAICSTSHTGIFRRNAARFNHTEVKSSKSSHVLPFNRHNNEHQFGQVVRSNRLREQDELNNSEDMIHSGDASPFRNVDGSFIKGSNAEEARLHDSTLEGRMDHNVTKLPDDISIAINNNILRLESPNRLRNKAAQIYKSLNEDLLQAAPTNAIEASAHIAALFLQDYAHCHQVLLELQKRVGKGNFNPQNVLSVGYGPATGMVALNEIMGGDFKPQNKEAYIVGRFNREMKKRAKIILSRQANEQPEVQQEAAETQPQEEKVSSAAETQPEAEDIEEEAENTEPEEYVGPVDTSRINIRTKLRDALPVNKQYDLIIVNQALLTKEHHFPRDIDINIHMILKLLSPEGHIVLVERGNSLGFETIARARQLMIRPESYTSETGKIPRPYIRGSSIKPQKLRHVDQIITEEHIKHEEEMLAKIEKELEEEDVTEFERTIIDEHGEVSESDLKFEFEDSENFELLEVEQSFNEDSLGSEAVDYHLEVIAPCSHHAKCPLQLGDPKYYKIPSHKHRLKFCSFDKVVERPRFTMELKKGKRLASSWDKSAEDGFGLDKLKKGELKRLSGSGRPGGLNTENGSYSYLIARRAPNSIESIKKIEHDREFNHATRLDETNPMNWPRVLEVPSRIKNNVKLTTCAPSGNIEIWQIPKSLGKQEYHDARKVERGDLWALGKKSVIVKNKLDDKVRDKLDVLAKTQKKSFLKEQRKKKWKKLTSSSEEDFDNDIVQLSDSIATNLEASKKYKLQGKRAGYDVDARAYDGK